MANNNEFIEFLSPNALADLKEANAELAKMVTAIGKVNSAKTTTPSQSDNNVAKLTADYNKLLETIEKLKAQIKSLTEVKAKANAKTSEEIVNGRLLARNADLLTKSNSALAGAYGRLSAQRTKAAQTLRNLIASEQASNAEIRKAQKEFDILDKKVRKADAAVRDFSKSVGNYKTAFSGIGNLMGAFGIGTGLFLTADIAKNIFKTTKELESLDLALEMVSGTAEEFAKNQAFLNNISEQWGLEIKSLTQQYTQFYTASKDLLSEADIQSTFEGIAKAGSLMGLSLDKQADAFYAIDQMMSKGTVTAEELKKQLGNAMPGAIKAAAMAYQQLHPEIKSIQEAEKALGEAMKQGALDSATYVPLIVENLNKIYGTDVIDRAETLQSEINRLSNAWTEFVRSLNEGDGVLTSVFKNAISLARDLLGLLTPDKNALEIINTNKARGEAQVLKELDAIKQQGIQTDKDLLETSKLKREFAQKQVEGIEWELNALKDLGKTQEDIIKAEKKNNPYFYANTKRYKDAVSELSDVNDQIRKIGKNYGFYKGVIAGTLKFEADSTKKVEQAITEETEEERKKRLKLIEDYYKTLYDMGMSNLEREKFILEESLKQEEITATDKLDLQRQLNLKEIEIAKFKYDELLRLSNGNLAKQKVAINQFATDMDKIKNIKGLDSKLTPAGVKTNDITPGDLKYLILSDEHVQIEKDRLEELKRAVEDFVDSFRTEFISDAGLESVFKIINGELETFGENWIAKTELIMEATQEMYNFIADRSQRNFEEEYDRLEKQKNISLAFAGESAAAKEEIEKQYAAKRKEIAKKEAKDKQTQAIFNIIIDTAQAVMASFKNGFLAGLPQAVALAAVGAAQIALVKSQKVPEYWKGTDNAEGGWAWTQERGAEIITDKSGNIKDLGDNKGARLTKLDKGDKVLTASKTKQLMFNNDLNRLISNNGISRLEKSRDNSIDKSDIQQLGQGIVSAIQNKTEYHPHFDKKGFGIFVQNGNVRREILNNEVKSIGKTL